MFIVLELQTDSQGNLGIIANKYNTIPEAESKYYNILSYAALSDVPVHAAVILDENGTHLNNASYMHAVPTSEPEPTESEVSE